MKKTNIYLSNKHLYGLMIHHKNEVVTAKTEGKKLPRVPRNIGESILLICSNLIKKPNFSGYSPQYKDEMKSDAILDCLAAIDNFDPDKTNNPFAYFTQIAWNAFVRRIQKEKKHQYIKQKNYENSFILMSDNFNYFDQTQHKFNEITSAAIEDYEKKYLNGLITKKPKSNKI